jgi:hypothetical protein
LMFIAGERLRVKQGQLSEKLACCDVKIEMGVERHGGTSPPLFVLS